VVLRGLLVLAVVIAGSAAAEESVRDPLARWPHYIFSARGVVPGQLRDSIALDILIAGTPQVGVDVVGHIGLPSGLRLVSGDSVIQGGMPAVAGEHRIVVAGERSGTFEVECRASFERPSGGADEIAYALPLRIAGDSVRVAGGSYTCLEYHEGRERFRYAGFWLVPVDSSEIGVGMLDQRLGGRRAELVGGGPASCRGRGEGAPDSVGCLVFLDPRGLVREVRCLGWTVHRGARVPGEVCAAVTRAVRNWRFSPAQWRGQAVSDYCHVKVPVVNGR
jgi:hypothetical protein